MGFFVKDQSEFPALYLIFHGITLFPPDAFSFKIQNNKTIAQKPEQFWKPETVTQATLFEFSIQRLP